METVTYFTFIHEPGSKGENLFPQVPLHVNKRHINLWGVTVAKIFPEKSGGKKSFHALVFICILSAYSYRYLGINSVQIINSVL